VTAVLSVGIVEYHGLVEWEEIAARDLDRLLRDDPANVAARTMRGFIYLRAGLYPQAERELRIAEEEAPDCATVAFYQCLLHGARGERAKALAKIEVVRTLGYPPWRDQSWLKIHYPEMEALRDTEGFSEFKR
jgi:tetratricopeptide (TPR) repeat protein